MGSYTFVMLKPDALERGLAGAIVRQFVQAGFVVEVVDYQIVRKQTLLRHYEEVIQRIGGDFAQKASACFVGKPVLPMVLRCDTGDAVALSRALIGATDPAKADAGTLRGDYGQDSMQAANAENRCVENLIHGSDSEESFRREAALWLGDAMAANWK